MRQFRLKQKAYESEIRYEDGHGSTSDVVHNDGETCVLWRGMCTEEPDATFFAALGIEMPEDENEERGGDPGKGVIGDSEYSYLVEELVNGKWKHCSHLHAHKGKGKGKAMDNRDTWWQRMTTSIVHFGYRVVVDYEVEVI